jgi:hypothetical protein
MHRTGVVMAMKARMSMSDEEHKPADANPLAARLAGRIEYLLSIKRVKDPELMVSALEVMTDLADATKHLLELTESMPYDGTPSLSFCRMRCEEAIEKINGETV